jgi:drug/metabolite transporter (DMT)-like permease
VLGGALVYLSIWNIGSALAAVMIPSGQAAILGFTMPVWAALIGWLFFRERLSGRQWLAVALTACGVLLLTWRSLDAYRQAPLGVALALLAAVGWAGGTMIIKRSGVAVPATVLSGWQLLVASLPVTAVRWSHRGRAAWSWPSPLVMLAIAYITIVPMGVGNVVWFAIVGLLPAHLAGLSTILVPVVAMVSGAIVHGEPLGPLQIVRGTLASRKSIWSATMRGRAGSCPRAGWARRAGTAGVMRASSGMRLPLRPLQARQAVMQFIQLSRRRATPARCARASARRSGSGRRSRRRHGGRARTAWGWPAPASAARRGWGWRRAPRRWGAPRCATAARWCAGCRRAAPEGLAQRPGHGVAGVEHRRFARA